MLDLMPTLHFYFFSKYYKNKKNTIKKNLQNPQLRILKAISPHPENP